MSKWKPIELAIDLLIVTFFPLSVIVSPDKLPADTMTAWDKFWVIIFLAAFARASIDLYEYYKENF